MGSNRQQTQTYQFLDNVTMTQGKHTYKFGADYRYLTALFTSVFDSLVARQLQLHKLRHRLQPIGNPFAPSCWAYPSSDTIATVLYPDTNA